MYLYRALYIYTYTYILYKYMYTYILGYNQKKHVILPDHKNRQPQSCNPCSCHCDNLHCHTDVNAYIMLTLQKH